MSLEVDVDHARASFHLSACFSAAPGLTALFGRSGSGKTTLVDIMGGLIRPDRGKVSIDGTRKWKEEGFTRPWPDVIKMPDELRARVDELWRKAGL